MGVWWSKILVKNSNDGKKGKTTTSTSTHDLPEKRESKMFHVTPEPQSDTLHDTPEVDPPEQPQEDVDDDDDDETAGWDTATPSCSLWDRYNPEQQGLVCQSDQYKDMLRSNLTDLVQSVLVKPMMPVLRQLEVIDADRQERIELQATQRDMVMRMVSQVEKGPMWHLHGFLRGLAVTNQEYLIPILGMDKAVYIPVPDHPEAPAAAQDVDDNEGDEEIPMEPLPVTDAASSIPIKRKKIKRKKRGLSLCCGRSDLASD